MCYLKISFHSVRCVASPESSTRIVGFWFLFSLAIIQSLLCPGTASAKSTKLPIVVWSPATITYTIGDGSGTSEAIPASFRSSQTLSNVRMKVIGLRGMVAIDRSAVPAVAQPGVLNTLALHFSLPPKKRQGTYRGRIRILANRGVPQVLNIVLNVQYGAIVIPPTTKVLSPDTVQLISSALTARSMPRSRLVFAKSTPALSGIQVGDVVVADVSASLPNGFIGRVKTITKNGPTVTIEAGPASLAEAVTSANISISQEFTPSESAASGSTWRSIRKRKGQTDLAKAAAAGFSLPFDESLYDSDNIQIEASGSLSLTPSLDFDLAIDGAKLKQLNFVDTTVFQNDLSVKATGTLSLLSLSKELFSQDLPTITIWVGWLPVVIVPQIVVTVGLDGSVSANLTMSAAQTATLKAGVAYSGGQWQPVSSLSNDFTFEKPALSVDASADAFVEPQLNLLFYGVGGPDVNIHPYLELDINALSSYQYQYDLEAGINVGVGVLVKVLDQTIADYQDPTLITYRKQLTEGEFAFPTATATATATGTSSAINTATPTVVTTPIGSHTASPSPITSLTPTPTPTATSSVASPWPMFHHDARHTGLSSIDTTSSTGVEKWSFAGGTNTPWGPIVSSDGTIYMDFTPVSGFGAGLVFELAPDGSLKQTFLNSSSQVAIGGDGTIYFGNLGTTLTALNFDGSPKWAVDIPDVILVGPTIGNDGTIYFGGFNSNSNGTLDSHVVAVNADGTLRWRVFLGGEVGNDRTGRTTSIATSHPAIGSDGTVFIGSMDTNLYAIDGSGSIKWHFPTGGFVRSSPAVGEDGTIYVGSQQGQALYAVNPDGTEKWKFDTGGWVDSSPAIGSDGTIYVGSDPGFYAINPDGTQKWKFTASESTLDQAQNFSQETPVIAHEGTIYVSNSAGELFAIRSDGTEKWHVETGDFSYSSPAIGSDGTIYFNCGSRLHAIH